MRPLWNAIVGKKLLFGLLNCYTRLKFGVLQKEHGNDGGGSSVLEEYVVLMRHFVDGMRGVCIVDVCVVPCMCVSGGVPD